MIIHIPKIIMQTWKTETLPDKWQASQDSIKKFMPTWQYILMTDDMNRKFIEKYFYDFLSYYDSFPYPIQRADAVRYCWLYMYGGLYLDCDFELLSSLDEVFSEEGDLFLVASPNTPDVLTNAFMACKPKLPIWLDMIEEMKKPAGLSSIEKHLLVLNTTGPLALNRVVKRESYSYIALPGYKLIPYTICDKEYNQPQAIMRPLEGSSWVSGIGNFYHWSYCQSGNLLYICLPILIIIIVLIIILELYLHYWV